MDILVTATTIILLGCPGMGKSTLFTSLTGVNSPSGTSIGCGLTRQCIFGEVQHEGRTYTVIDTPGYCLSEVDLDPELSIKKIFGQITKEIAQRPGPFKFFFITTLDTCRLREDFLNSLRYAREFFKDFGGNEIKIIYNFIGKKDFARLEQGNFFKHIALNSEDSKINDTPSAFLELNMDLIGGDNCVYKIPQPLKEFIFEQSREMKIAGDNGGFNETNLSCKPAYYTSLITLEIANPRTLEEEKSETSEELTQGSGIDVRNIIDNFIGYYINW